MKTCLIALLILSTTMFAGETASLKIGSDAPSFTLKNYDGKEFTLQKVVKESKYTVVMFISTECPVSNAYNERMVKLHESFGKKNVTFLGINSNKQEDVKMIASHSKEKAFTFPVLKDELNKVADAYGAQVTPEVYVIDGAGKLVYHGRIDDSKNAEKISSRDLAETLDALLASKKPTRTETKAFGCTIKRVNVYN